MKKHSGGVAARSITITTHKIKFSIKDYFTKCDQSTGWSHLLKKSLMENIIFLCSYKCNNLIESSNNENSNEEEDDGTTCKICMVPRIELTYKCGDWVQCDV